MSTRVQEELRDWRGIGVAAHKGYGAPLAVGLIGFLGITPLLRSPQRLFSDFLAEPLGPATPEKTRPTNREYRRSE